MSGAIGSGRDLNPSCTICEFVTCARYRYAMTLINNFRAESHLPRSLAGVRADTADDWCMYVSNRGVPRVEVGVDGADFDFCVTNGRCNLGRSLKKFNFFL